MDIPKENLVLDYVWAGVQHPPALVKPRMWYGYFPNNEKGQYQKKCFNVLKKEGFKRTCMQLGFKKQNAGLIKLISNKDSEFNEAHVRFYRYGAISCELEYSRYGTEHNHILGPKKDGSEYLEKIILESELSKEDKNGITKQIRYIDNSKKVRIPHSNPIYRKVAMASTVFIALYACYLWEYKLGTFLFYKGMDLFTYKQPNEKSCYTLQKEIKKGTKEESKKAGEELIERLGRRFGKKDEMQ